MIASDFKRKNSHFCVCATKTGRRHAACWGYHRPLASALVAARASGEAGEAECSVFGIAHFFEIGNQPRAGRMPSQPMLGQLAGNDKVPPREHREKSEVGCRF